MINSLTGFTAFFIYGGYYAILMFLFNFQLIDSVGNIYSIFVRIITIIFLTILSIKLFSNNFKKIDIVVFFLILSFSILYSLKIFYFDSKETLYVKYQYFFYFLAYCFLPFLFFSLIDIKKIYDKFFDWMQNSNFIFLVLSIIFYGVYLFQGVTRLNSSTVGTGEDVISPLVLSYVSSLAISIAFVNIILLNYKKKYNILIIILAIPSFLLGASRGAILVLLCAGLILIILTDLRNRIKFLFFGLIFSIILYFVSIESSSSVFVRFMNISEDVSSNSDSAVRLIMWRNALNEFNNNILFGGLIELDKIYPHNIYVETLMATGILGFLCLISSILLVSYKLFILVRYDKKYVLLTVFFLNAIVQYFFSGALYFSILFFTAIGITLGIHISNRGSKLWNL